MQETERELQPTSIEEFSLCELKSCIFFLSLPKGYPDECLFSSTRVEYQEEVQLLQQAIQQVQTVVARLLNNKLTLTPAGTGS